MLSVYDLDNKEAIQASTNMRRNSNREKETLETVREAISIVGGRLSYLSRASKARDMLEMANHLKTVEKGWLLSRIGLIRDCDDDVMDEVKILPEPTFVNIDTYNSKNGVHAHGFSYKSSSSREKRRRRG